MKRIFKKEEEPKEIVEPQGVEVDDLYLSVLDQKMPAEVEKILLKEVDRMRRLSPSSAEYSIALAHIDYVTTLPWHRYTKDNLDITRAEKILDSEHYGLEEIKERILEHLAVRQMKLSRKNTILVVDDEKVTRMNLEHVLSKEGYQVDIAEGGTQALEFLKNA